MLNCRCARLSAPETCKCLPVADRSVVEFLIDRSNCYLAIDFDLDVVTGHFQRRKGEMPGPHQKRPLHHDEAISARIGKYAEKAGCENQERSFHCPVVGIPAEMLRFFS